MLYLVPIHQRRGIWRTHEDVLGYLCPFRELILCTFDGAFVDTLYALRFEMEILFDTTQDMHGRSQEKCGLELCSALFQTRKSLVTCPAIYCHCYHATGAQTVWLKAHKTLQD